MRNQDDEYSELYSGIRFSVSRFGRRWRWQVHYGKTRYSKSGFATNKENAIKKARNYIDKIKQAS